MKCEHCGYPAMRGWILCRRCWLIFADDALPPPHPPDHTISHHLKD